MSGGERANIGKIAEKISDDLFKFFKWEIVGPANLNFLCVKKEIHAKTRTGDHHHPTDVVFKYFDPYANKMVYLHTDLKSYAKGSIGAGEIRKALVSLAKSIDCACVSPEWRERYLLARGERYLINGMLFVFNHDDLYDRDFFDHFKDLKSENLHVKAGQQLHIVEPALINYIATLRQDINSLIVNNTFPKKKYTFLYPEMTLHKAAGEYWNRPATVEMIASPYLIIHHGEVHETNEDDEKVKTYGEGYLVYYRRSGASEYEFMYLFDALSRFQILNGDKDKKIRIRIICKDSSDRLRSNYQAAIANYVREWNEDEHRRSILERIELEVVTMAVHNYKAEHVGWER
ncbi:hypothetical protein IRZ53_14475 [Pseudomonas fulva]|uniref:hypothetical protein n=1 Tax=Pseudomonas fulva TaxID=47880 RepID=UPI0018A945C1|nr:hypothetical protein [Pseudomonas fulva]MBF8674021.1 hypothetical protein [Pseudomonas fulva]MBF8697995.1 hypothetical protein [Pseudomonas fulva]